ncbi:hypothetical protein BU17DRAFT_72337 [Hysterangium stoloniferum]|nr:hypothetical protein BU17DRAFT_72337 [Hysterangium stoloniferum]
MHCLLLASRSAPQPILPVILCVPEPASFPLLMHYLYTKRPDHLFAALLPAGASVHGLWSNVTAMGVFDDGLSKCRDGVGGACGGVGDEYGSAVAGRESPGAVVIVSRA